MEIISTTITRIAKATTELAEFNLEYFVSNNELTRATASIYTYGADRSLSYLGTISYENETIICSLPIGIKSSSYFEEFEKIMLLVNEDVQSLIGEKE